MSRRIRKSIGSLLAGAAAVSALTVLGPADPARAVDNPQNYDVVSGDFDNDGYDDMVWYGPGSLSDEIWYGSADGTFTKIAFSVGSAFDLTAGDFDNDGYDDLLWYRNQGGRQWIWYGKAGRGQRQFNAVPMTAGPGFRPQVGDFDNAGGDDIFWYRPGTTAHWFWYANGNRTFAPVPLRGGADFKATFVGDFDGDNRDDIFWLRDNGGDWIWFSGPNRKHTAVRRSVGDGFTPIVGDLDGDNDDDVFWWRPGPAGDWLWTNNGRTATASNTFQIDDRDLILVVGDFNGDNRDDIYFEVY